MGNQYDTIVQLTSGFLPDVERLRKLNEFSHELGWKPSDRLEIPVTRDIATAHLLVEHGLEHTAVLSFILRPLRFPELSSETQLRLLSISYNNLVDWHLAIEAEAVNFVYVRTRIPTVISRDLLARDNYDRLRSEIFEQLVTRHPNPNIPALDDAMIRTISFWKRNLSAELNSQVSTADISALFNALIFVRALEDNRRRVEPNGAQLLIDVWDTNGQHLGNTIGEVARLITGDFPRYLLDEARLKIFDALEPSSVRSLLLDFYLNRYAPYRYDFSIISLHALSRIYEHYVSLLEEEPESPQLSFIPSLPQETVGRIHGAIYTPQFIARFFARYLREHAPPVVFRRLRSLDPACGSGIFLRTLLELQTDPIYDGTNPDVAAATFENVTGIDVNENAVHATKLSLALLYLALFQRLPDSLNVICEDALRWLDKLGPEQAYDAIVTNPPFIAHDDLPIDVRMQIADILGPHGRGKNDLHLAFLKRALDALKPGGIGLFVLPHSFLIGDHAAGMRSLIASTCWIHCLADLSAVRVFEATGIYVILLIFQKRPLLPNQHPPLATIVKCQELVGKALQDVVEGNRIQTRQYSVYDVSQNEFAEARWTILPPSESNLKRRLAQLPRLKQFLSTREGIVTGADKIFIVSSKSVPKGEEEIYIPLLRDREMAPYTVPKRTESRVFFPYRDGTRIDASTIRKDFPQTWRYLLSHRAFLETRPAIKRYKKQWWEPLWPRPASIQRPKIVVPHLVLVPKFALDARGRFGVSHSPILLADGDDIDILKFFLAVLNSSACFWYIANHSHRYGRGYTMLEPKTLENVPVPDPSHIPPSALKGLLALVNRRLSQVSDDAIRVERELDAIVAELYDLSAEERLAIGLDYADSNRQE